MSALPLVRATRPRSNGVLAPTGVPSLGNGSTRGDLQLMRVVTDRTVNLPAVHRAAHGKQKRVVRVDARPQFLDTHNGYGLRCLIRSLSHAIAEPEVTSCEIRDAPCRPLRSVPASSARCASTA